MANAPRDGNFVPTLLGTSSSDGKTPIPIYADPTSHRLLISAGLGIVNTTWGTNGNTATITDANCTSTCFISVMPTTVPVGNWKIVPSNGSFVITSSDSESGTLSFSYKIFP